MFKTLDDFQVHTRLTLPLMIACDKEQIHFLNQPTNDQYIQI